jgi:hypothetical protein
MLSPGSACQLEGSESQEPGVAEAADKNLNTLANEPYSMAFFKKFKFAGESTRL